MAARDKTIVLSDVHVSNHEGYAWFQLRHELSLVGLLNAIGNDPRVKELVLLGDMFDLWLYPINEVPWTIGQIIEAHGDITKALGHCVKNIPDVYYMNGNHDMGVSADDLEPYRVGGKRIKVIGPDDYRAKYGGKRHFQHGHEVDMFNAPDTSGDTIGGYPLGYFITRLAVQADEKVWGALKTKCIELHKQLEQQAALSTTDEISARSLLVEAIVDLLCSYTHYKPKTPIRFLEPKLDGKFTVEDIKDHYKGLYRRWYARYPGITILATMLASRNLGGLEWYAKELMSDPNPPELLVMGHTHKPSHDDPAPYTNDGCFCGDHALSYVEIVKDSASLKYWFQEPE